MTTAAAEWVSLTHEEPIDSQRRIVDAHHHLWGEGQGLGGSPAYLGEHLRGDMNGHNVVASVYVECGIGYRTDGPEHLRPVGETVFAASEARRSAGSRAPILGIVAHADLALDEAEVQDVLDLHAEAGCGLFRGIRQLPGGLHGGGSRRNPLTEPAFHRGVAQLGRNGFSLDAFATSTQLPALASLARGVPGTTIILNHIGMPIFRPDKDDRGEVMATWREGMRALAHCSNVLVKLGGIGMDSQFGMGWSKQERPPTSDQVVAWWGDDIRFCIDSFGPDRCLFESNFPVDRWALGYTVLWNAFQKMAAGYSDAEQEALFSGTAIRAYRLEL
jgi:predicted TIM-barrel fold metal-dependent hydrolase